jgi:hypothetical protein
MPSGISFLMQNAKRKVENENYSADHHIILSRRALSAISGGIFPGGRGGCTLLYKKCGKGLAKGGRIRYNKPTLQIKDRCAL